MKMNFQVVIEGKRGGGYKGDIAIDDVSFTPGCNVDYGATLPPFIRTFTPQPGCKSGEFKYAYCYNYSHFSCFWVLEKRHVGACVF